MLYFIINLLIGGDNMVEVYVALIINDMKTFDDVRPKFRDAVRKRLAALGLDENGNPVEV